MAKKKKKDKETTIEDYYDLKVDKVDELVAALKGEETADTPTPSMNITDCTGVDDPSNYKKSGKQKKFDPYKTDFLGRIPAWIKALVVKWWFAGVVCYFINMGLGINMDSLDLLAISGVVMGLVVELLVNPILRFMESDRKEFNPYMMFPFPFKAYWTFFTNIIYYVAVVFGAYYGVYYVVNSYWFFFPVEPFSYGLVVLAVDMLLIGVKDLVVFFVKKLKQNKEQEDV